MTHIPRAFCAHCDTEMKLDSIGKTVETFASGRPYYKIQTDKYTCTNCGTSVLLADKSTSPIHHHDSSYEDHIADYRCNFR